MNLHGPQDDRDRHWNGRWDHHREDLARKEAEVGDVLTCLCSLMLTGYSFDRLLKVKSPACATKTSR
jgi:hypothetical protein